MNADCFRIARNSLTVVSAALIVLVLGAVVLSDPASAQQGPKQAEQAVAVQSEGEGSVRGQIIDTESGAPLEGVTVTVIWQTSTAGTEPRQKVDVTDANGIFKFASVPTGNCSIKLSKAGYRVATTPNFAVKPGEDNRADSAISPLPPESASAPAPSAAPGVEEFVVVASPLTEILGASRMDSDELINTLNAAELSKFAASDVADALRFVPGVNVVQGQFAVIRGLEDRYNSTLYNSAPMPSPDPDSQSVQLDLFPSDIVSNLVVAKTFAPDSPSNTSGGLTNIITHDYPEEFELKLSTGSGFSSNAWRNFIDYESDSPIGKAINGWDTVETDFGVSVGGRKEFFGRDFRFKTILNQEIDYETADGFVEGREPQKSVVRPFPRPSRVVESADLSLGELSLSAGRFDLTESNRTQQGTGYQGFGVDLDEEGNHKIDGSVFYTKVEDDFVQLQENGYLPNFDYGTLAALQTSGNEIDRSDFDGFATLSSWIARSVRGSPGEAQSRGPLWYANFSESESFQRERKLLAYQLNGDHQVAAVPGLHFSWAGNQAETTQKETSFGAQYFYEPDDTTQIPTRLPTTPGTLGPGQYYVNDGIFFNQNDIRENQDFGRFDGEYETTFFDFFTLKVSSGGWYERANRDVSSSFLESPSVRGSSQFAISGASPQELGKSILDELDTTASGDLSGLRDTTSDASREIKAWSLGSKATFWDRVDLLAGFRLENISISSINDPFTGEDAFDGSPSIFPTKYLFFDRLDNPDRNEIPSPPPPGTVFNDEILGIDVPVDPTTGLVDLITEGDIRNLIDGEIDQNFFLPSLGFAYRPIEGLSVRGAFSRTVARPSFREMGFYVSVEPGTDDLIVGNPQLQLSEVTSWDARAEYTWGSVGDLVAVSLFKKAIENPIESILVRNPLNFEGSSSALFRTFFNNPSRGSLRGIEAEARKNFGFLGFEFAQYFSVGGNYTYIDAKVNRTEAELNRSEAFFGTAAGDRERFSELEDSRRLFGQPEWIANVDISFDHPDWGTKITLAYFAISNVLDAAGSASIAPDGSVQSFVPDRYLDAYGQLDLVMSQTFYVERLKGDLTLKASIKNLTDSSRGIVYDTNQTINEISERAYKVGRDFAFSLTYTF
jgi:outer membrane receptor protein involved in Fe transport